MLTRRDVLLTGIAAGLVAATPIPALASPPRLIGLSVRCFPAIVKEVPYETVAAIHLSCGGQPWVNDMLDIDWLRWGPQDRLSSAFYIEQAAICGLIRRMQADGKIRPRPGHWPSPGSDWMWGDDPATWRVADVQKGFHLPGAVPAGYARFAVVGKGD
jgi:hypothetical protein